MEDTGQDTTIRIGVDGTGVSAGVTSIKRSLADLGTSVKKISDDTNSELGKIGTGDLKLGKGVEKATKDTIKQTGELLKQLKMVETQAFTGFSNIGKSAEAAYVKLAAASVPENYIASYIKALKEAQSVEAKRVSDAKAAADAIAAANAKAADAAAAIVQKAIADEAHYADLKKQHAAYNQAMAEKSAAALKEELALTNQINEAALRRKYGGSAQSAAYYAEKAGPMAASPNVSSALAGLKAQEEAIRASAEAQKAQQLKILGLNNQIQAARTAAAERVAQETSKIIAIEEHYADLKRQHAAYNKSLADQEIASTKARAAALAAYYAEAQNAELNMIHTGRGKSSAYLIDKGQRLGFTEAEINTAVAGNKKIEASLAAAFAAANPHIGKLKAEAEAAGTSVKGLSASLRNVPAQFTDIVVSLQGGQAPLTVLLQQGGQLRDMFGSTGGAFRALGGYVMGLINPLTLAAGAAATLYMAYRSGASETEAYNKAMINTGNAAGVTASRLAGMAESVSATTGSTIGAAASALAAMTSTSGIAASQFEKVASTAVMMEKVTGVAMADTVKQFAELGKDPVTASEKLNETTHYLTAAVYEQIKALQDQGDKAGAAALAQSAYADSMKQRLPELAENLGYVERAWKGITGAAKGAWDAMSGIGRQDSTQDRINAINQKLAGKFARSSMWDGGKALDAELAGLQKVLEFDRRIAEQEASKAKSTEASITLSKQAEKSASNEVRLQREIAQARATYAAIKNPSEQDTANYAASVSGLVKSLGEKDKAVRAGAKTISDAEKGLKLYNDLTAAATGLTSDFAEKQALLAAKFGKDGNMAEYQKGMAALIEKQPYMVEAAKAEAEAIKAIDKARTDAIKSHAKELESLGEKAQKLEDEVAMYGMSKEAIEELTTARMLDQIEVLRGFDNSAEEIARIEQVIEARKRLAAAGTALDLKDAGAKYAKDLAAENKKAAEASEKYWEDALMRAFESGKGFFESLWDTIKNTLKTQVLKVTVQGVMGTLGIGAAGAAVAGESGGGGLLGTASNLSSLYSAATGSLTSSLAGAISSAGTTFGSSALTSFATGMQGATLASGMAGPTTVGAGGAIGAGASFAQAMPWIGGALAVYAIADSLFGSKGGPKSDSSYNMGGFGDASATGLAGTYATGVEDAWKTLAKELEITTALKVGALTSIDTQGDARTILRANATVDGVGVYDRATRMGTAENVGRSQEELQAAMAEETTRILFAALKASDLPEQYKTYLSTIGDSVADMTEAMTIVAVVDDFNDALQSLPFENLKTLSFEAAKGLIEVAGGMDVLGANLGTYYTNFYSAEEQRLQTIKTINAATAGSGLDAATATRDQFRQIVEAQDLTTESGRATYAALLGVSGAFAGITQSADDLAKAASDAAEKLAEAARKIQEDSLKTNLDLATTAASDAYSAIERAVSAQRDAITSAYESQSERIQASLDGVSESVGKLKSLSDSLKSTLDGMRVAGSDSVYRAAAQAQISAALATARAGGGLPLDGQLESALRTVSQPSEQLFGSFEDYARDFYKTANDISALGDLTGVQLSAEEATQAILKSQLSALEDGFKGQTKALDDILENAKQQLDAANGLDTSVLSLADALAGFSAAIQALVAERAAQDLPTSGAGADYFTSNPDVKAAYAQNTYGLNAAEYANVHYGLYGKDEGRASPLAPPAATAKSYFELYPDVAAAFAANAYGMSQIEYSARHFANFGKAEGRVFPGFAVGTNYVPSDMIAQIHEGEAIVPKAYNPAAGGQNNAELVAEIRALRQEVASLKASNEATAKATSKFASQFETASEGGRALLTEVYA